MFIRNILRGHIPQPMQRTINPICVAMVKQIQQLKQTCTSEVKTAQKLRCSSQQRSYFTKSTPTLSCRTGIQENGVYGSHFEAFTVLAGRYSDVSTFRQNDPSFRQNTNRGSSINMDEIRERLKQQLDSGAVTVPEMRAITSIPKIPVFTGKESFIGFNCDNIDDLSDLLFLAASSEQEDFFRVINPHQKLHPVREKIAGVYYDPETDKVMKDGEPVETVSQEQALKDFIDFLKRHSDPALITYQGKKSNMLVLYRASRKYGLFEQITSTAPVHLDAFVMARKVIPFNSAPNLSLDALCRSLIQKDVIQADNISRVNGIRLLFTKYLMQKGYGPFCSSSDFFHAKDTYLDLVANKNMHLVLQNNLSRKGLGLDHLMYLKKQGYTEFEKCLSDRNIKAFDIEYLYKIL